MANQHPTQRRQVEEMATFQFVVNLETGKQIGVTIPQSVLFRADRVIR